MIENPMLQGRSFPRRPSAPPDVPNAIVAGTL
jgi:hypothetical protein